MTLYQIFNTKSIFDSHAHLAYSSSEEVLNITQNAKDSGLQYIFNMGIDLASSVKVIEQSKNSNNYLKAFVGIDPEVFEPNSEMFVGLENKEEWIKTQINSLIKLIEENKEIVLGIGETGMDYYHFEQNKEDHSTKETSKKLQKDLFIKHLELAQKFKLPLSIHSRWAEKECLEIVKDFNCVGIFHSYTGDYNTAKQILDYGWGLGVNGIVTFKNAVELREIYKKLIGKISTDNSPEDFYKKGIFFETDSPFLSPEGKRGQKNEPANVKLIFESFINYLK